MADGYFRAASLANCRFQASRMATVAVAPMREQPTL
jgi:hypothetical protein